MSKKKRAIFVIAIIASLSAIPANGTAPAKPGVKCIKAGLVQVIGNKKFTCIKTGSKLAWNKGVLLTNMPAKSGQQSATPTASSSATPTASSSATPTASETTPSHTLLIKYKNCTEVKAAGQAPLTKSRTPELYELNSGLDRDKDGVACEN